MQSLAYTFLVIIKNIQPRALLDPWYCELEVILSVPQIYFLHDIVDDELLYS